MDRRVFAKLIAAAPFLARFFASSSKADAPSLTRVRPSDPVWPSEDLWKTLGNSFQGELIRIESPLAACVGSPANACAPVFHQLEKIRTISAMRSASRSRLAGSALGLPSRAPISTVSRRSSIRWW